MKSKELSNLSKEDLIQKINDLQKKYLISSGENDKVQIDYRTLLEATSDIIFVIDKDGNLVYINSAWKEFFPSWAGKTLGGHFLDNIPAIEKERASFVFNEVIHNGKTFENEMMKTYNEKNQKIYMTMSLNPVKSDNDEIVCLIGIMKNITEKHIAEKKSKEYSRILEIKVKEQLTQAQELKGLRDFNEDIINHAPIGIFVMDPSGIILSENTSLKKIMAHGEGQTIIGTNLLNNKGFVESELGRLYELSRLDKKIGRAFDIPYTSIISGRQLTINATVVPVTDAKGTIEKIIFMVEDHTEQAAITRRVYEAEKLSALGILSSGVASELKYYVSKMVMDLNFVDNNLEEGSPAIEYLDSLHHQVGRIKNITAQLVSLSAADEKRRDICDINKILTSHQVDVMLKRLRSEGFEIVVEPANEPATVQANQEQLQQLFIQFIENAEEAMPEKGTISIQVKTKPTPSGKIAIITISDTGIGIPEENLKKIFQPFFTTKGKEATGLGLMITSAIVQNLGGAIGLKSSPGEGTSFRIALPVVENPPAKDES
ncbi:MAG: PAS domain S-box protein [Spirochaetes bacterium]|nr:PAS domain S-box protein [Spirochaetota bacterium]